MSKKSKAVKAEIKAKAFLESLDDEMTESLRLFFLKKSKAVEKQVDSRQNEEIFTNNLGNAKFPAALYYRAISPKMGLDASLVVISEPTDSSREDVTDEGEFEHVL